MTKLEIEDVGNGNKLWQLIKASDLKKELEIRVEKVISEFPLSLLQLILFM